MMQAGGFLFYFGHLLSLCGHTKHDIVSTSTLCSSSLKGADRRKSSRNLHINVEISGRLSSVGSLVIIIL